VGYEFLKLRQGRELAEDYINLNFFILPFGRSMTEKIYHSRNTKYPHRHGTVHFPLPVYVKNLTIKSGCNFQPRNPATPIKIPLAPKAHENTSNHQSSTRAATAAADNEIANRASERSN